MSDGPAFHNHFSAEVATLIQAHVIQMQAPRPPRPMEVPRAPEHWVGREALLQEVERHLAGRDRFPVLVTGDTGTGKSALAAKIAERAAGAFPDGQLYIDLENEDVLSSTRSTLMRLGIPKDQLSETFGGLLSQFRTATRDQSMLVVLDGVDDAAEGLHFTPSSASSALAVFALRSGGGEEARHFALSDLDRESAMLLLCRQSRGPEGPMPKGTLTALLDQFGTRPGTLRRLAGLIRARRAAAPASFDPDLRDLLEHPPADLLDATYRTLSDSASWLYRLLSVLPGPEFERSILKVLRTPAHDGDSAFAELVNAQLVTPTRDGSYLVEPSVTRDAIRRIELEPLPVYLVAAMEKSLRWYVKRAQLADRAVMGERLRRADLIADVDCPPFEDRAEALAWLQANHAALHAAIRMAVLHAWNGEAWALAEAMWAFYVNVPYPEEAERVYEAGVAATNRPADRARMLLFLGRVRLDLGEYESAEAALDESRAIAAAERDTELIGSATELLGRSKHWQGRHAEAIALYEASLEHARDGGHARAAAIQLMYLGRAHRDAGDAERAADYLERALAAFTAIEDGRHVLLVEADLTVLRARLGVPGAVEGADLVIGWLRQAGLSRFEADAQERLAAIAEGPERRRRLEAALEVHERIGSAQARRIRRELA
ncbi:tetratricopeptide repeat protein [Glycomyces paridis]|uniref:Tetratricopeptide repeat protein n=1 Tax=Glycomyces paridis TaxID=2126555 RepID=A0A4V4HPH8_9ACTN|nr:tetratricopeptide repeat protein [Glycomyces paridis]THV29996.1 tetratricopeptide repeat protein [Glycomyces paridis]